MAEIGAADVAVGQVWRQEVAPDTWRDRRWRVEGIVGDRVTLVDVDTNARTDATFGSMLSLWQIVER